MTRHRFVPRYRGVAWTAIGVGGALGVVGAIAVAAVPVVSAIIGVGAGAAYLLSPTWKLEVVVDDRALAVHARGKPRFELPWSDVVKVIAAPTSHTCFVDGGEPARSLLVPGEGAPAPYDLVDRAALFDAILAHVPADRVETVDSLEPLLAAEKPRPRGSPKPPPEDRA